MQLQNDEMTLNRLLLKPSATITMSFNQITDDFLRFVFVDHSIRVIMLPDDKKSTELQPWFAAKDVCDVLGLNNTTHVLSRLDIDEKGYHKIQTNGGMQNLCIINEYGLYSLVLGSRKKSANNFKRWLKREVLPSLRKYGLYATDPVIARLQQNPDELKHILEEVQQLKQKVLEYELARAEIDDDSDTSGYVYVASSDEYIKHNIYKIGSTKDPETRIVSLNTSRDIDDSLVIIKKYHVFDYQQSEKDIHKKLDKYRNSPKREFFTIKLTELIETLDLFFNECD